MKELLKKLQEFSDEHIPDNESITAVAQRDTVHLENSVAEELESVIAYVDIISSKNSVLNRDKTIREVEDQHELTKGFKSKLVSLAISNLLEDVDTPTVKKVRFKHGKTTRRAYLFTENNILTLVVHSNRGKELKYLSSETETEEYINDEFQKYVELSE